MKNSKFAAAILALSVLASSATFAQDAMINGEVKKVDETAKKITLKHGAIKNLGMDEDGMTMVFRVRDAAMLKQVKAGDKVQFAAERGSEGITIVKMQKGTIVKLQKGNDAAVPPAWASARDHVKKASDQSLYRRPVRRIATTTFRGRPERTRCDK